MQVQYTAFGERSRQGRPRKPAHRPMKFVGGIFQKTKRDKTPRELALDNLKKELNPPPPGSDRKGIGISETLANTLFKEAVDIKLIQYMHMKTLAAALLIIFRMEQQNVPMEILIDVDGVVKDIEPYKEYTTLSDEELLAANESGDLPDDIFSKMTYMRFIRDSIEALLDYVVEYGKRGQAKEGAAGEEVQNEPAQHRENKNRAELLTYLRVIYLSRLEKEQAIEKAQYIPYEEPTDEQLVRTV